MPGMTRSMIAQSMRLCPAAATAASPLVAVTIR
jgi:hypothetical protein